jgi:hypothetical protein
MHTWEHCAVYVTLYREGSSPGEPQELLQIRWPNQHKTSISHQYGVIGLLNQLGGDGWELVDVENGVYYLKRPGK